MFNRELSPYVHSALILTAIVAAYSFNTFASLQALTLQAFAAALILYFVLKRLKKAKPWHIVPSMLSGEMALVTFSFLLLIGATGNFDSVFYPLAYIHLFFLVFSAHPGTAIAVGFGLVTYHYALEPNVSGGDIANLINLPLILLFFLFTKQQYNDLLATEEMIEKEERQLVLETQEVVSFLEQKLKPKLDQIRVALNKSRSGEFSTQAIIEIEEVEEAVTAMDHHLDGFLQSIHHDNPN